jgi:hypothetical protein
MLLRIHGFGQKSNVRQSFVVSVEKIRIREKLREAASTDMGHMVQER